MNTYGKIEIRSIRDENCYLRTSTGERQHVYVDAAGEMHDQGDPLLPDERASIKVTLSAANLGPQATEADFDAWASYVVAHIDEALGLSCEVDQAAFTGRGAEGEDRIQGATDEQRDSIRGWLSVTGWEAFCAQATAA